MVEVFKINVYKTKDAKIIIQKLNNYCPTSLMNFDLEDSDKILRVESEIININSIRQTLNQSGFFCEVLK